MSIGSTISCDALPIKSMPGPKGNFLTGNLSEIKFEQFHQYVKQHAKNYGPVFRLSFAHKPAVVLSDPELVKSILKNRPEKYRRISSMESVFSELGVDGVFSSEGELWLMQRKMMNQAFKSSQLEHYYPIIENTTERLSLILAELAKSQEDVDWQALMQRYTVDITSSLAFGYDMDSLNDSDSELQKMLAVVFPMISNRVKAAFPYWRYIKFKKDKQLDEAIEFIKQQCNQFIQAAEAKTEHGQPPKNILEAMIIARDEQGNSFSQQQLFSNIITLLLAGEDTTANSLSWIIHYLVNHPKYQDDLYQEIRNKLPTLDLSNPKALDEFPLIQAVINEAMRLMPVAPFLYLENISDENIAGYKVSAGTIVVVLLSQAGHDPDRFDEPDVFKPERWLNMSVEEKKKYAKELMHFGGGPRQCPGMQLSLIEMKFALISMLKQFEFSRAHGSPNTKDYFAFTVMPKDLIVNIRQRV